MTYQDVSQLLTDLGVEHDCDPRGIHFTTNFWPFCTVMYYRIHCGSGIAGNARSMFIAVHRVNEPEEVLDESFTRKRDLRRRLIEALAGPKPVGAKYARLVHGTWGSEYKWI